MVRPATRRISGPGLLIALYAGYVLGGLLTFRLLRIGELGAALFPSAGLMVGVLVLSARRRWPLLVATGIAAELTVELWQAPERSGLALAAVVAADTVGPIVCALALLAWAGGRPPDLARRSGLLVFVAATGLASLLSAAIGALGLRSAGDPVILTFAQWWLGTSLGIVLIGGVILARVARPDRRSLWSAEGLAMLTVIPAVVGFLYWATDLPLGFVILLSLLPAAARFGTRAVTLMVVLVATAVLLTVNTGDLLLAGVTPSTAFALFKLQVLTFTLAALLLATEVVERERAVAQARVDHQTIVHLQQALLPPRTLSGAAFRAEGIYVAASEQVGVGGDWYDVVELADGRVFAGVGDVVGHGEAAVVAMGQLRFALAAIAGLGERPGEILSRLDEVSLRVDGARYASVWVATFDPERGELAYSSAGHPPALLLHGGRTTWLDEARSVPLGMRVPGPRPTATVPVGPGATVLLFTDGAVERRGESLELGFGRLARAAAALAAAGSGPRPSAGFQPPVAELLAQVRDPAGRDDSVLLRWDLAPSGASAGTPERSAAPADRRR